MDNIAEGFERGGRNEFINFLSYSKGSCGETLSQLYRAHDRRHINDQQFHVLKDKSEQLGRMIGGLVIYLNSTEIRGTKFKGRT
jgi:four helix bundle protein